MADREPAPRRVAFGSCQERKLFPIDFAPNRLGNEMSRQKAPHLGPGCYDNHEFGTMVYDLQKRPESKKGYVLSARTAGRFLPSNKTKTPSPQKYQQDQTWSKVSPPGRTPFSSTTLRFKSMNSTAGDTPGPDTYNPDAVRSRKVSWPMCFGSPDWQSVPAGGEITKLNCDMEFRRLRARVAYLSLYY